MTLRASAYILTACIAAGAAAARAERGAPAPAPAQVPSPVEYARDVQPILEQHCYECHGPKKVKGSLRLDTRAAVFEGGMSGPAILPGNSEQSVLIRRLRGLDNEDRMPLDKPALSNAQLALLRRWVDEGAPWPEAPGGAAPAADAGPPVHWAYVKPARPDPPRVRNEAWVRTPIDRFVLAQLEAERLSPAPEADRAALLRRVSLDLVGLPPTIDELDAFLADERPDAYERTVDRLLASPHYGERWARPWLDLARYADSHGYEKDRLRTMWRYRDWVIDALNRDVPFDRFTIEQIAGDMLPDATDAHRIATGFHRNTMLNQEGGIDVEEARFETLLDRVNTTGTVWLGTTIACAQCHNHKYDPFSQRDYYRLLAFFDNGEYSVAGQPGGDRWIDEPTLDLPTREQAAKRAALQEELARLKARFEAPGADIDAAQAAWERRLAGAGRDWSVLAPVRVKAAGGTVLAVQPDGSVLAGGPNPAVQDYEIEVRAPGGRIAALRLEVLPEGSLPKGGPGRDYYGNFVLTGLRVEVAGRPLAFGEGRADDWIGGHDIKDLLNPPYTDTPGDLPPGWSIDATRDETRLPRQAVLRLREPLDAPAGTPITVRLSSHGTVGGQAPGRVRLSASGTDDPYEIVALRAKLRPALDTPPASRTPEQQKLLGQAFRTQAPELEALRTRIGELEQAIRDLGIDTALVMRERASHERPSTALRERGSFLSPGERVYAGTPRILPPLPDSAMPNRLGLAQWLVSADNPLTARVTVNRAWEQFFGRGLVETSEDFGTQGSPPTHPELLDWLATELVSRNWSLKALHRTIVRSATYRQGAVATPALLERDPDNRLLARGPRFRMEAEMIRDTMLAASGLLSSTIGGPSVFPPQPPGIWDNPYSNAKWVTSEGPDRYRRGLYTFLRRTSPYPAFMAFDATSREYCTVRRVRTNTPLQALAGLNDEAAFEAARALAARMVREGGAEAASRAAHGFRLCTSRQPAPAEVARILASYEAQLAHFASRPRGAAQVAGTVPAGTSPGEAAAWTLVANALLNLDETLTK